MNSNTLRRYDFSDDDSSAVGPAPGSLHARAKRLPRDTSHVDRCNVHAREWYALAVEESGGFSAVADEERCDESAVRRRVDNAKLYPNLAHCIAGLSPEGLSLLASKLEAYAHEKARRANGR